MGIAEWDSVKVVDALLLFLVASPRRAHSFHNSSSFLPAAGAGLTQRTCTAVGLCRYYRRSHNYTGHSQRPIHHSDQSTR